MEPGSNGQTSIKGQPDQSAHLVGARVVPYSGYHLRVSGVLEIQLLNKGADAQDANSFPRIPITPCSKAAEKGRVPHQKGSLPMLHVEVPGETFNEA